jgi:hypothetical protein
MANNGMGACCCRVVQGKLPLKSLFINFKIERILLIWKVDRF